MDIIVFTGTLLLSLSIVALVMLYLRRTTRQVIIELCKSEAGAEFWLKSADILAYSGALILVLMFGKANIANLVETLRLTLILTLSGIFITVMFVARNVWRNVNQPAAAHSSMPQASIVQSTPKQGA